MIKKLKIGSKDLISKIIIENYDDFLKKYSSTIAKDKIENIKLNCEKLKGCKDISSGYTEYICPDCFKTLKIGFTCKSKFCTSCSTVYSENWIKKQNELLLDVTHRHMVFTIPDKFRKLIYDNIDILKELSQTFFDVILGSLNSGYKDSKDPKKFLMKTKGIVKPAIISVLHTFGRDLKFNPHFHLIVAEGGFRNNGQFKKINFFHYKGLRYSWRKLFLDVIKSKYPNNTQVKRLISGYYNNYDGFYVRAKDVINDFTAINKYLGRYLSRPPFSSKNIIKYTKQNITYKYKDYKTDKEIIETIPTLDFLGKLFYHLMPKSFRTIRRMGVYARNIGAFFLAKVKSMRIFTRRLFSYRPSKLSYAERFRLSFGVNPLNCKDCNVTMEIYRIFHPKNGLIFSLDMLPSI